MYEKVNWKNYPETDTPITAENLGKMDNAIKEHDNVVEAVKNNLFSYNASTGELTIDLDALGE